MNKENKSFRLTKGNESGASALLGVVVLFGLIGVGAWYWYGGGFEKNTDTKMNQIKDQVAVDAVNQYQIAKKSNDLIQICVQAGLVSAAYLQAEDETNYLNWKQIERNDCERAGVPF